MESLRRLLRRPPGGDRANFLSAQVVETMNYILHHEQRLTPTDATATHLQRGTVFITTTHGAIAARIHQQETQILQRAKARLGDDWPKPYQPQRLVTRAR